MGCVSHESLLCGNEGLASLEVHTDPPPTPYFHCWLHIAPIGAQVSVHNLLQILITSVFPPTAWQPTSTEACLSLGVSFHNPDRGKGAALHKDPPGGLIHSPRQAWSLRRDLSVIDHPFSAVSTPLTWV